jgi:hypothetical protein
MFRRLRALVGISNLEDIVTNAIKESEKELLDLLRSQLSHGEKGDGQMPSYASEKYAEYKQKIGSQAPKGITDLKLTGAFQNKLRLIITERGARIRSYDKKKSELLNHYSKEIYELNAENQTFYLKQVLFPIIIKKVKNVMYK